MWPYYLCIFQARLRKSSYWEGIPIGTNNIYVIRGLIGDLKVLFVMLQPVMKQMIWLQHKLLN